MKKYVNFLQLIEGAIFVILFFIIINLNDMFKIILIAYWIVVFIVNISYYTINYAKYKKTPLVAVHSLTPLIAYLIVGGGTFIFNIKNKSYFEFIKSANDHSTMSKKQRIVAFIYYILFWIATIIIVIAFYYNDNKFSYINSKYENITGNCLLIALAIIIIRIILIYVFANNRTKIEIENELKKIDPKNKRQFLKIAINNSPNVISKKINDYLLYNKFIQTNYNGEKVIKLNNLNSKQSFYDTYIKLYLTNQELIVIGWINYKNVEYGFSDVIDLDDNSRGAYWKPVRQLYNILFAIAKGASKDNNIICEPREKNNISMPQNDNLFSTTIPFAENKKKPKLLIILVFSIIFIIIVMLIEYIYKIF